MQDFIYLYNFNGITVLYKKITNIGDFIYRLNHYTKNNDTQDNIVYIITNPINENINMDFMQDKIYIFETDINFELFYYLQELRHDYFYKNNILATNEIKDIFYKITVPIEKYTTRMYDRRECFKERLNSNLNNCHKIINIIKEFDEDLYNEVIDNKSINDINIYNILLDEIYNFLINNIDIYKNEINFKEYCNMYKLDVNNFIYKNCISKNIMLEDVYYIHKCWFDKDKNPLFIKEINQDFEYKDYIRSCEKQITDITEMCVYQDIKEEVMYLDYRYGFYNFGEFWDVIKRLLVTKKKNLPLFHLTHNRINNINYYFNKLNFQFPTMYQKTERSFKLYHFNKINITTIGSGGCRGYIDKYFGYNFNKLFNPSDVIDKSYNIYLARGPYGRGIINENKIVDILINKYNFVVLNGSENLENIIHYFTNAKIILGAHGSLMKNMIWSKKNPILVELCPPKRANLDMHGNAYSLGFIPFFFLVDSNDKEEIILDEIQEQNLYYLLDIIC
jgi:hypothetical protein